MRIESGVNRRALMRQGMFVTLLLIFAGWFGYDGWIGYPRANMQQAKQSFPVVPEGDIPVNAGVTEESFKAANAKLKDGLVTLADLEHNWGEPAYKGTAQDGTKGDKSAFFVGTYGWVKVALVGNAADSMEWVAAPKDPSAVLVQKLLAAILAVIAMIPLGILLGYTSGKYVLDDEGLTLPGGRPIKYPQMTAIDFADLRRRGIVRLTYQNEKGESATAVLDEEKMEKFDDIVLTLCETKGWQEQLEEAAAQQAEPNEDQTPKA